MNIHTPARSRSKHVRPNQKKAYIQRKKVAAPRKVNRRKRVPSRESGVAELPGWHALNNQQRSVGASKQGTRQSSKTMAILGLVVGICVLLTLYVGHVLATEATLEELRAERARNVRLNLKYNRLKGAFDRRTGPAVIYRRGAALGLEQTPHYGPTIIVK